jgi:hypothetical protein
VVAISRGLFIIKQQSRTWAPFCVVFKAILQKKLPRNSSPIGLALFVEIVIDFLSDLNEEVDLNGEVDLN